MKSSKNLELFKTHREFNRYIESEVRRLSIILNSGKTGKLHPSSAAMYIDSILDITYEKVRVGKDIGYKWYYREYGSYLYKELTMQSIGIILVNIAKGCQCMSYDITKLSCKTFEHLRILADGEELQSPEYRRPPAELLNLANGILNLKTKVVYPIDSDDYLNFVKQYHFFKDTDIVYNETPQNIAKYELAKSYLRGLANGDEGKLTLFKEILFATIEGNGRHKYFMVSGDAGVGKSTFQIMCTALAGQEYTQIINVNKLDNPNSINNISSETKLIVGDD